MRAGRLLGLVESVMVARAARRYYFENRSKIQIAEELGISRFKVAQLLDTGSREWSRDDHHQ